MYKITLRKRAAKEYLEAIIWYKERSLLAAENFIKSVNEAFSKIEAEPEHYRNSYKHFYKIRSVFRGKCPKAFIYEDRNFGSDKCNNHDNQKRVAARRVISPINIKTPQIISKLPVK